MTAELRGPLAAPSPPDPGRIFRHEHTWQQTRPGPPTCTMCGTPQPGPPTFPEPLPEQPRRRNRLGALLLATIGGALGAAGAVLGLPYSIPLVWAGVALIVAGLNAAGTGCPR